jgi:hypothetical protein
MVAPTTDDQVTVLVVVPCFVRTTFDGTGPNGKDLVTDGVIDVVGVLVGVTEIVGVTDGDTEIVLVLVGVGVGVARVPVIDGVKVRVGVTVGLTATVANESNTVA